MPKNFAGESFTASLIAGIGNVRDKTKGVGEHQDFPPIVFSLTVPKNFVGQLCCAVFQKLSGSENFMDKRGDYKDFPSKNFSLTVPKNFAGESSTVPLISGIEKFQG